MNYDEMVAEVQGGTHEGEGIILAPAVEYVEEPESWEPLHCPECGWRMYERVTDPDTNNGAVEPVDHVPHCRNSRAVCSLGREIGDD